MIQFRLLISGDDRIFRKEALCDFFKSSFSFQERVKNNKTNIKFYYEGEGVICVCYDSRYTTTQHNTHNTYNTTGIEYTRVQTGQYTKILKLRNPKHNSFHQTITLNT